MRASSSRESILHVVFNTTSRTLTALAREALVNRIMKNCKWEHLHWAGKVPVEERTKYTAGKLMDPCMESKELGDSQLKKGLMGMIRSHECIQQLVASEAISAASSMKKYGTAIVSQGIDSLCTRATTSTSRFGPLGFSASWGTAGAWITPFVQSPRAAARSGSRAAGGSSSTLTGTPI